MASEIAISRTAKITEAMEPFWVVFYFCIFPKKIHEWGKTDVVKSLFM